MKIRVCAKKKRTTLPAQIAAQKTFADKWIVAARGGMDASPIQKLAFSAANLRKDCAHDIDEPGWSNLQRAKLKSAFADLLFPALLAGDIRPFEELTRAICDCRKCGGNLSDYVLMGCGKMKVPGVVKAYGRFLRLFILGLAEQPEDRQSMETVMVAISKAFDLRFNANEIRNRKNIQKTNPNPINAMILKVIERHRENPADQRTVEKAMKEIGIELLKPGQRCQWWAECRIVDGKKVGKLCRELVVKADGTLLNRRLTREQIEQIPNKFYRELLPNNPKNKE